MRPARSPRWVRSKEELRGKQSTCAAPTSKHSDSPPHRTCGLTGGRVSVKSVECRRWCILTCWVSISRHRLITNPCFLLGNDPFPTPLLCFTFIMAAMPKPSDSKTGGKATVLLGSQWGDEVKASSPMCSAARWTSAHAAPAPANNAATPSSPTSTASRPSSTSTCSPRVSSTRVVPDSSARAWWCTCRRSSPSWTTSRRRASTATAVSLHLGPSSPRVRLPQVVDGLKEVELGSSSIGTTKKGIGPAYSSKASRSGLRVHHLYDQELFASKFRKLVEGRFKR